MIAVVLKSCEMRRKQVNREESILKLRYHCSILIVAGRYIIISLPNCWRDARRPIAKGTGTFAHYGLPVDPPMDRHKWFFNYTQAKEFLERQSQKKSLKVVEMFATEKRKLWAARSFRKLLYQGERYRNRYTQTLWVV